MQQDTAQFIGSGIYRGSSYGPWHPLRIPRVPTVIDLARALGWLPPGRYVTSPRARPAALTAFHTPAYVAALMEAEARQEVSDEVRRRHGLGTPSNPVFPEMFRRPATAVGGSILAGELVAGGGAAFNPGGGTHHGFPDRAAGFCYFNDPVFAILSLRARGLRRVAYIDIDAHHPDGVAAAFDADPEVLLVSLHEAGRWPRTGAEGDRGDAGSQWNLPLVSGASDTDARAVLGEIVGPLVAAFRPEAVVLQCGADAVTEDPQSRLCWSNRVHLAALALLRPLAPRLVLLGGGGYNPWSVARCWTALWGALSGKELPDRLPPAASAVLSALRWDGQARVTVPPAEWTETLVDPPREAALLPETRAMLARATARLRAMAAA